MAKLSPFLFLCNTDIWVICNQLVVLPEHLVRFYETKPVVISIKKRDYDRFLA